MKTLILTIMALLLFPAQAMALDLTPMKKPLKQMTVVGSTPTVSFSDFRIQSGNGRTDWFAYGTNTSKVNIPRNHYELRAYQIDKLGRRSAAGQSIVINRDIRPGGKVQFTRDFTPGRDIHRVMINIVSRTDNTIIGSGTFSASQLASEPTNNAAASAGPTANQHAAASAGQFVPTDLGLTLKERRDGKVELTVKNNGSGTVNLGHYRFGVNGHLMFRPTQTKSVTMSGELRPGKTTTKQIDAFSYATCGNFTHYSAQATGSGLTFETRLDVEPVAITLSRMSLALKVPNHKGEIDEWMEVQIVLDVDNTGTRKISNYMVEGSLKLQTNKGTVMTPFALESSLKSITPGRNRIKAVLTPGTGVPGPYSVVYWSELWFAKPERVKVNARLSNNNYCGVPVVYTESRSADLIHK